MCGIVGFVGRSETSSSVKLALQAIQHRGQDSAGIGLIYDNNFLVHKDSGYVASALKDVHYNGPGVAIGHVRYPTRGGGVKDDAQPFFCRQPGVIMAHNGNIINFNELKTNLKRRSINLSSRCDVEPVLYLLCDELMKIKARDHSTHDVVLALKEIYKVVKGAFSIIAGLILDGKPTLLCARDPYGIRPAVWGRKDGSFICASESVCIDVLDAEVMGDIPPGEVMFFTEDKEPQGFVVEKRGNSPCVFENIYFARPDSITRGNSIYSARINLGKILGKEFLSKGIEVDIVTAVPDTSIPAALSMAEVIGKPYTEGFIKNRYSARTFIMPTQISRENALRLKLNPIISEVKDRKILLVDDSIVRGTTLKKVVSLLKNKGKTKEIHLAIHCPPVVNPCFYGIDMSVQEDLIAHREIVKLGFNPKDVLSTREQRELEFKVAENLGADSLTYLSINGLNEVFGGERCAACFDGQYPIELNKDLINEIRNDRIGISCNL